MTTARDWVRLPTRWISDGRAKEFRWVAGEGSNAVAAPTLLAVIAHHADGDTGARRRSPLACLSWIRRS